jgi:small-conductance mechanosensitive channel
MTSPNEAIRNAAQATERLADRGTAPVTNLVEWFGNNLDGLLVGSLVAAGLVGIMLIMRALGQWLLKGDPQCSRWRGIIGSVLAKTNLFFMIATAVAIVVNYAQVPAKLVRLTEILFIIAATLQAAIWAREIVIGIVRSRVGEDPGASTLGNAMGIIRILVSVAAFGIAAVVILDNLGVNVTALVAGLGVGGIAIGLAAQGIFSDLFAGLSIVFDKPFRRGQTIRYNDNAGVGGTVGTVEKIGMKTTRLRAVSGEEVVMSNTKLLELQLTNVAETKIKRIWLPFGVTYQTSPDVIEALPGLMTEVLAPIKGCKVVRCVATQFGPSSIDCELVYDDRSVDPDTLAKHKSAIILGIMKRFAADGIEFAYPTQTTFTAAPDGTMIMPYASVQPVTQVDAPPKKRG